MSRGRYYPKSPKGQKGMPGARDMVKQIEQVQRRMEEVQQALEREVVEYSAGGGVVKVTADGRRNIKAIKIDPQVIDPDDVEMLEDLILAAVNGALEESARLESEKMEEITGGITFPGL